MAKHLHEVIENPMVLYREPRQHILGHCSCGCKEMIVTGYEYIEWDDRYFVDRSHVIDYLKRNDGLREVG